MKGKYITLQIRLACARKPEIKQDLCKQVEKTILEHNRIMQHFAKPVSHFVPAKRKELATL
jgi:hypothetical protein